MKDVFARAINTEENKIVKVTELPGGGLVIEGITRQFDEFQGGRICLSDRAVHGLIKLLKEWESK